MSDVIMRYQRVARLNIGTEASPIWELMGEGFNTLDVSLNPKIDETQYINDENASKSLTGYSPQWDFDADVIDNQKVIEYIRAIAAINGIGNEAESQILVYDLWEVSGDTVSAVRYDCIIAVDSDGSGAGGEKLSISGTIHATGDPVTGTFNVSTRTFTPDAS